MKIALIHYPVGMSLPAPWQPDWGLEGRLDLGLKAYARGVARARKGTPIPEGCTPYVEPVVTYEHRVLAQAALSRSLAQMALRVSEDYYHSDVNEDYYHRVLKDSEILDAEISRCLGKVHPFAEIAPLSVRTMMEACEKQVHAEGYWISTHSCVVVRTLLHGYQVWRGIGTLMEHLGSADTYEAAEKMGVDSVYELRQQTMVRVRKILRGWSKHTRFFNATLATAEKALPIHVRRGPLSSTDLAGNSGSTVSWDLPVVAIYSDSGVERHDERVTWDDDASRKAQWERQAAGEARAQAQVEKVLSMFANVPALADRIGPKGLTSGSLTLRTGEKVFVIGPVRLSDYGEALALVKVGNGRGWMNLAAYV